MSPYVKAEQFELSLYAPSPTDHWILFTDGSCRKNPGGAGGWACVVLQNEREVWRLSGGDPSTTSNRMEQTAVIRGLEKLPEGVNVTVVSDSQYVVKGANVWHKSWKRRQWQNVKNPDLWQQLVALKEKRQCTFLWCKGHSGNKWNELCDRLCGEQALAAERAVQEMHRAIANGDAKL